MALARYSNEWSPSSSSSSFPMCERVQLLLPMSKRQQQQQQVSCTRNYMGSSFAMVTQFHFIRHGFIWVAAARVRHLNARVPIICNEGLNNRPRNSCTPLFLYIATKVIDGRIQSTHIAREITPERNIQFNKWLYLKEYELGIFRMALISYKIVLKQCYKFKIKSRKWFKAHFLKQQNSLVEYLEKWEEKKLHGAL